MTYIRHIPCPPLNSFINCVYYRDTPMPFPRAKIFPLPYQSLYINFGSTYRMFRAAHAGPPIENTASWLVGLWNEHHIVHWASDVRILIVDFKPGGAYPFLQFPLSELHNQTVSMDLIWGRFAAEIRERLYAVPTVETRFALLDRLLLARLREAPQELTLVQYALQQIAGHRESLSIRALSDDLGISQKHLITLFKRLVGGTPKELERLFRFKHVLHSVDPSKPVDWARIAQQTHYYDQSHFIKDFDTFTGNNPNDYLRLRLQASVENSELSTFFLHLSTG
jgi:AraC-like DNA-binding protein